MAMSGAAFRTILCLCARGSFVARTFSPPRRTIGVAPSFHSIRQMRKNARTKTEQPNRPLTMRAVGACNDASQRSKPGGRQLASCYTVRSLVLLVTTCLLIYICYAADIHRETAWLGVGLRAD